jgi:hypothetical protein
MPVSSASRWLSELRKLLFSLWTEATVACRDVTWDCNVSTCPESNDDVGAFVGRALETVECVTSALGRDSIQFASESAGVNLRNNEISLSAMNRSEIVDVQVSNIILGVLRRGGCRLLGSGSERPRRRWTCQRAAASNLLPSSLVELQKYVSL